MKCLSIHRAAVAAILLAAWIPCRADEGMWLFNKLPLKDLRSRYDFSPPAGWAEHLMRSAVRISSGGSGSFVSSRGLIMTNHHVGSDSIQKLSTPERNLMNDGFLARSLEEELPCPDEEVVSLVEIVDVTEKVNGAVPPGADPREAGKARREAIARIEKSSKDATGLMSEVVTLYRGGAYHLYRYKRYDDVRLVMAPETDCAFFGGDVENFEYPRACLDVCFLRVYEDGKPARTEHYLRWSDAGASEGDLVFVVGHPGSTKRQYTVEHLRFLRDVMYPFYLEFLAQREITLQQFSLLGSEQERMARDNLFMVQNSRKARRGSLAGLLDPSIFLAKSRVEADLLGRVAAADDLGASLSDWTRIRESRKAFGAFYEEYQLLEAGRGFSSRLYGIARALVRLAAEKEKPNPERLPGYRESDLESLQRRLFSPAPIHVPLEKVTLADSLTFLATHLGPEHPLTQQVLAGRSPVERAAELVAGTDLASVKTRRKLAAEGTAAIEKSTDAMIVLARTVDPYARAVRTRYEDLVQGVERQAYADISRATFRVRGTDVYPDATFTLRLAFGVVKGYQDDGREVSPFTRMARAFELSKAHGNEEPYRLAPSWKRARSRVDLSTPFNFVCTADIIGGNSGSPVVNRKGEIIGLIFDGNIQSLVLDYYYTEKQARAVAVASQAIVEALRKIYGAGALAAEILGTRKL